RWLLKNKNCLEAFHEGEKQFRFKPAEKKQFIPDLVGCYLDGYLYLTGIEAKNEVRDKQGFFDQAVANLAFCKMAYLAIPKKEYDKSEPMLQQWIRDTAMKNRVGLLLVLKTKVIELVPAPLQDFSLKWYNKAIGHFSFPVPPTDSIWKVNDACTGCGTCVDVCPVDPSLYTTFHNKAHFFGERASACTECYACVDSCPEGAIEE
ncbi:MAG: DUF362 domain-containing protein, partial [Candidatus Thorarchaeota archaeon]